MPSVANDWCGNGCQFPFAAGFPGKALTELLGLFHLRILEQAIGLDTF
jgi:hypothetical protein